MGGITHSSLDSPVPSPSCTIAYCTSTSDDVPGLICNDEPKNNNTIQEFPPLDRKKVYSCSSDVSTLVEDASSKTATKEGSGKENRDPSSSDTPQNPVSAANIDYSANSTENNQ